MSQYNLELQEKVEVFIAENGLSQSKAAKVMGVNEGFLSLFRNNNPYKGNIADMESKLTEFFKLNEEKEKQATQALPYVQNAKYLPLSISEDICKCIKYCHVTKGIILVHGDAGIGKSKATIKYEQDNPATTIYIESSPSTSSLRETLRQFAKALRIPDNLRTADLSAQIKSKLKSGNKVVIIDEAQHLKYTTLEEITRWCDPDRITGKAEIAIVLMGNSKINYRMQGRQSDQYDQQSSRIKYTREYRATDIKNEDVELLFPYLRENALEKEIQFLLAVCQMRQGIRSATNLYDNVATSGELTYDRLFGTAIQMNIDVLG